MIFCIYHLFTVTLIINFEIKTQKESIWMWEKMRTCWHRNTSGTKTNDVLPTPAPRPPEVTATSCYGQPFLFFLYLSMYSFCSPHRNVPKQHGSHLPHSTQHPQCLQQRQVSTKRPLCHGSPVLFAAKRAWDNYQTHRWAPPSPPLSHVYVL